MNNGSMGHNGNTPQLFSNGRLFPHRTVTQLDSLATATVHHVCSELLNKVLVETHASHAARIGDPTFALVSTQALTGEKILVRHKDGGTVYDLWGTEPEQRLRELRHLAEKKGGHLECDQRECRCKSAMANISSSTRRDVEGVIHHAASERGH